MLLLFITCMFLMIVLCTYIVTALAFSRTAVLGGKTPWQLTNVICLVGLVLSGVLGITAHVATADDPSVFVMVLTVVSVVLSVLCAFRVYRQSSAEADTARGVYARQVELVTEWLDDTTSDLDDDVSGSVFWSGARWKEFDQELGVLMLLFPPEVFNHPAVVVRLGPLLRVRQDRDGFI